MSVRALIPVALFAFLGATTLHSAEKVTLNVPGDSFRGEVVSLGKRDVVIKLATGKKQTIPVVFLKPQDIYNCRRAILDKKDAKGHYELGLFCQKNGLTKQAEKEFLAATLLDPATYKSKVKTAGQEDLVIAKAPAASAPKRTLTSPAKPAKTGKTGKMSAAGSHSGGNRIDKFIADSLRSSGIPASKKCTDEEFLRRVYLDVVGIIPTPLAVQKFLADRSSDKRAKVIEELLASPHYGRHWTMMWGDMLKEHTSDSSQEGTIPGSYRNWIRDALNKNMPYDEFVKSLITAKGTANDDPASNFYLRDRNDRIETVNTISNTFMGTRMACAQCHDHPFDKWEQKDFNNLKAFVDSARVDIDFKQTVARLNSQEEVPADIKAALKSYGAKPAATGNKKGKRGGSMMMGGNSRQLMRDLQKKLGKEKGDMLRRFYYRYRVSRVNDRSSRRGSAGAPPFPWEPSKKSEGSTKREALANYIVASDLFPKVQVNRLWSRLMARGLVHPIDDFRPKNVPTHPELLDYLAKEFVTSKFDNKHILRLILNSNTYQRSTLPTKANREDTELYSHQKLRRMTAEQLYDSILVATGRKGGVPVTNPQGLPAISVDKGLEAESKWAYDLGAPSRFGSFMQAFHQPDREVLVFEREDTASITQALELFNGRAINEAVKVKPGTLSKNLLSRNMSLQQIVVQLYLSTLSRYPKPSELSAVLRISSGGSSKTKGIEDIHWALMNSREFMFIK